MHTASIYSIFANIYICDRKYLALKFAVAGLTVKLARNA